MFSFRRGFDTVCWRAVDPPWRGARIQPRTTPWGRARSCINEALRGREKNRSPRALPWA